MVLAAYTIYNSVKSVSPHSCASSALAQLRLWRTDSANIGKDISYLLFGHTLNKNRAPKLCYKLNREECRQFWPQNGVILNGAINIYVNNGLRNMFYYYFNACTVHFLLFRNITNEGTITINL